MTRYSVIAHTGTEYIVKIYSTPYIWATSGELDVTNEVIGNSLIVNENINTHHTASIVFRNTAYKFTDTTSEYFMFEGMRVKITYGSKSYKFIIMRPPTNVGEDTLSVQLVSASKDMDSKFAQIRIVPDSSGQICVEDIAYAALYDTGLHNAFKLRLTDTTTIYTPSTVSSEKTQISSAFHMVYVNKTVTYILNDICKRTGLIWFESDDQTSEFMSIINLIDIDTDYDIDTSYIYEFSTSNDIIDISVDRDQDSVTNVVMFENNGIPFKAVDEESIDIYGERNPVTLTVNENSDIETMADYAYSYLNIMKDPRVDINFTSSGIWSIQSPLAYVKIVDDADQLDTGVALDRAYMVNSIKYDLSSNTTSIQAGNIMRDFRAEKLFDLLKGGDSNSADKNEGVLIVHNEPVNLQVYTTGSYIDADFTNADDDSMVGVRFGIDRLYHATYSPNSVWSMDDDDIREGS